jgi:formate dehydrogenase iron-sulfur subunit
MTTMADIVVRLAGREGPLLPILNDVQNAFGHISEEAMRDVAKAGVEVERVSSWGMHWLEPLVDIDGIGYGPVSAAILNGGAKSIGAIEEHPFIAKQTRLTFARTGKTRPMSLDDY